MQNLHRSGCFRVATEPELIYNLNRLVLLLF